MPPAPSYPSPNAAQMSQGTMQYYNRQLTADELLSAELSRETAGANLGDSSSNGLHHGQPMVLGPSNPGASEMGRASSAEQQHGNMIPFPPNQQVGVDPNHDLSYGDQSARRKRSKVSRACDECRRKKVRCDATSESGVETCSNCRRLGVACQFSRVPMKRGPSKGYIKELAERLNTLESQMQPSMAHHEMQYQPMNDVSSPRGYHDFSPPMDGSLLGRKRTYSMSEGLHGSAFPQPTFAPRVQQASVGETATTNPESYNLFNMNLPTNKISHPFWTASQQEQGEATGENAEPEVGAVSQPAREDTVPVQVDEGALNAYYQKIHPIIPILPNSKDRFLEILHQCSRSLQEVFLHSFYAVTHTNFGRVESSFQNVSSMNDAQDLLYAHLREASALRSTAVNFIWLQTLQLMVMDCDARGPDNLRGKNGLPKSFLTESLARLAYDIAHHFGQVKNRNLDPHEVDSDANLARRGWVVSSILCRWHNAGMGERDTMGGVWHEIGVPSDLKLLGLAPTQLAAYSTILPPVMELILTEEEYANPGIKRLFKAVLISQLNRALDVERAHTESDEANVPEGYLQALGPQVYWTLNLLMSRHLYVFTPYEVLHSAEAVVKEMHKDVSNRLSSPIDMHSLVLATLTLLEGSQLPLFSSFCWEVLAKVEEILDRREKATAEAGEFENLFATPAWDSCLRSWIADKRPHDQTGASQISTANANADANANANTNVNTNTNTNTNANANTNTNANANTNANTNANANANANSGSSAPPPIVGPNEQRSLQHLADLAVGAEGAAAANASSPPATTAGGEGSAAGGTTASAIASLQSQLQAYVDFSLAIKRGYLKVIARGPGKR
ncbi:C6 finger domain protein [Rasamsonia emersonii CBS 393.64]|uniref:C6 finger domain protein n=1 Tax=Rasamsonia emersonii (strain ATCC 16479 / CBS 393.64 / IMI 116815) TaxID=1408163 RepID=A0A0F4Z7G1_RASE3|nr:C6 finger domain protein [Rasamsonia emersonii CBS 393.64]KKA25793.1 C6 finger domain protein [Rasamsonia emersonii CBS 393.64]